MLRKNPTTGLLEMAPADYNPDIKTGAAGTDPNTARITNEITARQATDLALSNEVTARGNLSTAFNNLIAEKKVYTAKLTQAGTDAPAATVLKDTITGLTWARTSAGIYTLTKTAAFTAKTVPTKDLYFDETGNKLKLTHTSADIMTLETFAAVNTDLHADDVLLNQDFYIEIYT